MQKTLLKVMHRKLVFTIKSYASQNRLCKSWIERHWNIWKRSL